MSTPELKERIIDYIEHADDKVLEAIYTLLEANVSTYTLTEEQMPIVEERMSEYKAGTGKARDWEDVKTKIGRKNQSWTAWKALPSPQNCRNIDAPLGPGVYQLRNKETGELIQFGIGVECQKRMKSLFPEPYGTGKRNNANKRSYILQNWINLEYRTWATDTREEAKVIEDELKAQKTHLFNT